MCARSHDERESWIPGPVQGVISGLPVTRPVPLLRWQAQSVRNPKFHRFLPSTLDLLFIGAPMNEPESLPPPSPPAARKSRHLLFKLLGLAVVGFGLPYALDAVFTPWAFFMGGHFHLNPKWSGWGRMHSEGSGDYIIYITISPSFGRGQSFTDIAGKGALCTQRGANYRLSVAGSFQEGSGAHLQGRTVTLYPHNYNRKATGHNDPSLELRGRWNEPDLVLEDEGSVNKAFDADGGLAKKNRANSGINERVSLTLHEGSRTEFDAACADLKRK
jgi:hypothetical protein